MSVLWKYKCKKKKKVKDGVNLQADVKKYSV